MISTCKNSQNMYNIKTSQNLYEKNLKNWKKILWPQSREWNKIGCYKNAHVDQLNLSD